jgi:hypothetical protein
VLYAMPYNSEELGDDGFNQAVPIKASTGRASAAEIMANAEAAKAKPISAPPAEQPAVEAGLDPWDGVEVAQPQDGAQ